MRCKFPSLVSVLATVLAFPASAQSAGGLTYIRCKFTSGVLANAQINYYLDDSQRRLLNDNKFEFSRTRQWSNEAITVAMPDSKGIYITFINRLTGELQTYTEGQQLETLQVAKCSRSSLPKPQF